MNNDTLQELLSVYHSLQKDSLPEKGEGWVNMANFGPALLKAGIDYKGMGYEKLNEFVSQSGVFEVYSDTSCKVPVKYIKEKKTERIFLKSIERNVRKQHIRILMR